MKALGKILLLLAVLLLTACEKPVVDEDAADVTVSDASASEKTKKFTFTLKGDFSDDWKPVTRGYLEADGKEMTDVWVLDYKNGVLIQQRHLTQTDEDWAAPVLNLAYGSHHVYFIASRGNDPTLDTDAHTLTFSKVLDTFYKDYEVTVVNTSNGNRAVTLDRVVTKLRLKFTDAISSDAATINITPGKWYYGWDYIAATPVDAKQSQEITIAIPDSEKGNTDVLTNLFGFSTDAEWQTNVTFNAKRSDSSVIGSATINNVPFKANRITEYAGKLFTSDGDQVALSLNSNWNEQYSGVW